MTKKNNFIKISILIICSIIFSIFLFEIICGIFFPYKTFGSATEMFWERKISKYKPWLTIDPKFGFRPILGENKDISTVYNEFGVMKNNYSLSKKENKKRILFVGDSVTEAGFFMDELKKRYKDRFEYWNAGVGSYNTVQEVKYYEKYNYKIDPDIIIMEFHMNDFETTPVAFRNINGKVVIYAPNMPVKYINSFFYKYSRLYRLYISFVYYNRRKIYRKEIDNEVYLSLKKIAEKFKKENKRFILMIYPICRSFKTWKNYEVNARFKILKLCKHLNLEYYDLYPLMKEAMKKGIKLESFDTLHPSRELCSYFAEYFYKNNILN